MGKRKIAAVAIVAIVFGIAQSALAQNDPALESGKQQTRASAVAPLLSSKPSPILSFTSQSAATFKTDAGGACAGQTCSGGISCFCHTYTGTLKAPVLGKSAFTAAITADATNSTPTGTDGANCFPTSGVGSLATAHASVSLAMTGQVCQFLSSGNFTLNYDEAFYILPGKGTGATEASKGSGKLVIIQDQNLGGAGSGHNTALVSIDGNLQKKP